MSYLFPVLVAVFVVATVVVVRAEIRERRESDKFWGRRR